MGLSLKEKMIINIYMRNKDIKRGTVESMQFLLY